MKSNRLSSVMPALVAAIHAFLASLQRERRRWPGQDPMQAWSTWWYQSGFQTTTSRIGETDGSPLGRHRVDRWQ